MDSIEIKCPLCGKLSDVSELEMNFTPDNSADGYKLRCCCFKCDIEIIIRAETEMDCMEKWAFMFTRTFLLMS